MNTKNDTTPKDPTDSSKVKGRMQRLVRRISRQLALCVKISVMKIETDCEYALRMKRNRERTKLKYESMKNDSWKEFTRKERQGEFDPEFSPCLSSSYSHNQEDRHDPVDEPPSSSSQNQLNPAIE